jgi:hypothetical protein
MSDPPWDSELRPWRYICIALFCTNNLMKPHSSVRVVRRWYNVLTDPVCRCFNNLEGLNNGHLPSWCGPRVHELANGLRLGTVVPKSGSEWSQGHRAWVRAN